MSTTELARRTDVVQSLDDVQRVAKLLALSGYFDAKGTDERSVAAIATKVLAGREMGFAPFASVQGIHLIQGKPTVSAQLMAAAVKSSAKYDYRIRQMDESACKIEFFERSAKGLESIGVSTFTAEDARKAGTQNMQKFGRNMMFARAMSNGVRWYCPDVFATGVYTPEEMGATVNGDGEIIEGTARVVESAPAAEPTPRFANPQEALQWAEVAGLSSAEAREVLTTMKAEHGGKLNANTAPAIYDDFANEVERRVRVAESDAVQPALVDGTAGGAAYNN
jgi:hypothetical protein